MNSAEPQFAIWTDSGTTPKVKYSLSLFHELDFQVNEGYRRIPHGGVEIGGILYGRIEKDGATIEAFRPIECEHASGPSFLLSESDLTRMAESFAAAQTDAELKDLQRVGWFISHTRGPLKMTEREAEIFNRYFPGNGRLTLLVKPERFQPTKFVFCVRGQDGITPSGEPQAAIILPLPGRAGGSAAPVPSIPAPLEKTREIIRPASSEEEVVSDRASSNGVTKAPVSTPPALPSTTPLPSADDIRKRRSEHMRESIADQNWRAKLEKKGGIVAPDKPASFSLVLVLILASLLGCAAGYWAYLQLPPATIPLRVEKASNSLAIRWPSEQTKSSSLAAIRIDDGQAFPLTEEQKKAGQVQIELIGDDTKIELIAHHSIRDSRGIIRYLRQPTPATAPLQQPNPVSVPARPPDGER